tara:strand:- start:29210 stop:29707 length:498 start_codon:yes stop_codon:yes gene_type:complete
MRILGIDPGLQKTGWGVISHSGNALQFVASGLIRTDPKATMSQRLATLYHGIIAVMDEWSPVESAIEETFVNKNPASALKLGQARGVLLMAPAIKGLSVEEYSANKVKKSVVGNGHAAKQQVGAMIKMLLPACGTISEDEADALAVAITHAHYRTLSITISGAKS